MRDPINNFVLGVMKMPSMFGPLTALLLAMGMLYWADTWTVLLEFVPPAESDEVTASAVRMSETVRGDFMPNLVPFMIIVFVLWIIEGLGFYSDWQEAKDKAEKSKWGEG